MACSLLPYLAGERTPIFDPDARGLIVGLTLRHGQPELLRAVLEGIAFAIRHNVETMASVGSECTRIVGVGGGTRGDLLPQIVADVLGREQAMCDPAVGASFGSAILAATRRFTRDRAWRLGAAGAHARAGRLDRRHLLELYDRYRELYPRMAADMHALARVEAGYSPVSGVR